MLVLLHMFPHAHVHMHTCTHPHSHKTRDSFGWRNFFVDACTLMSIEIMQLPWERRSQMKLIERLVAQSKFQVFQSILVYIHLMVCLFLVKHLIIGSVVIFLWHHIVIISQLVLLLSNCYNISLTTCFTQIRSCCFVDFLFVIYLECLLYHLSLAVVNLTLIDLPGLTKVAVGKSHLISALEISSPFVGWIEILYNLMVPRVEKCGFCKKTTSPFSHRSSCAEFHLWNDSRNHTPSFVPLHILWFIYANINGLHCFHHKLTVLFQSMFWKTRGPTGQHCTRHWEHGSLIHREGIVHHTSSVIYFGIYFFIARRFSRLAKHKELLS